MMFLRVLYDVSPSVSPSVNPGPNASNFQFNRNQVKGRKATLWILSHMKFLHALGSHGLVLFIKCNHRSKGFQ